MMLAFIAFEVEMQDHDRPLLFLSVRERALDNRTDAIEEMGSQRRRRFVSLRVMRDDGAVVGRAAWRKGDVLFDHRRHLPDCQRAIDPIGKLPFFRVGVVRVHERSSAEHGRRGLPLGDRAEGGGDQNGADDQVAHNSVTKVRTRLSMVSMIAPTFSGDCPFGSSIAQSARWAPGTTGQSSPQPIVISQLAVDASCGVSRCGLSVDRSIPRAFMAVTTSGWTRSAGWVPAETALAFPGAAYLLNRAAAICERPALCTQANSTVVMTRLPQRDAPT